MALPELSVVMPVYNGERYLKDSIESVLGQTYRNFELIIINDGSTDKSLDINRKYDDNRIKIISSSKNRGIPYSRNLGLQFAKGKYITWCDCDDICLRRRFEWQIDLLSKNRSIGGCGTWMMRFGSKRSYTIKSFTDPEILRATLIFKPCMLNASVMLRLDPIKDFKLFYNEAYAIAEDYDFIIKCSKIFSLTNIPKVLYKYRASDTSIMDQFSQRVKESEEIHFSIYKSVLNQLNISPSREELEIHRLISSDTLITNFADFKKCFQWLCYLKANNNVSKFHNHKKFNKVLAHQFYFISKKTASFGLRTLVFYMRKSFMNFGYVVIQDIFKLTIKCILKKHSF